MILREKFNVMQLSAQWCSGTLAAPCAGGTEFKSRSHHKRYSFARVA